MDGLQKGVDDYAAWERAVLEHQCEPEDVSPTKADGLVEAVSKGLDGVVLYGVRCERCGGSFWIGAPTLEDPLQRAVGGERLAALLTARGRLELAKELEARRGVEYEWVGRVCLRPLGAAAVRERAEAERLDGSVSSIAGYSDEERLEFAFGSLYDAATRRNGHSRRSAHAVIHGEVE